MPATVPSSSTPSSIFPPRPVFRNPFMFLEEQFFTLSQWDVARLASQTLSKRVWPARLRSRGSTRKRQLQLVKHHAKGGAAVVRNAPAHGSARVAQSPRNLLAGERAMALELAPSVFPARQPAQSHVAAAVFRRRSLRHRPH